MTFTVNGASGVLLALACVAFLAAVFAAWVGHRAGLPLIAAGLFLFALAGFVS